MYAFNQEASKHQNKKPQITRGKQIGVEIYKKVDDPEIPDLIESKVMFVSIIVPDGWEILNTWKPVEEDIF
jgi:hypothetical protein